MTKWQWQSRALVICTIMIAGLGGLGLLILVCSGSVRAIQPDEGTTSDATSEAMVKSEHVRALSAPRTCQGLAFKGITYVSWTRGEYPYSTSWKPQTYTDSQAITAVSVTGKMPYSGAGSLEMAVDLIGGHPNKSSGEAFVDLRYYGPVSDPPDCITVPINLEGQTIAAKVRGYLGSGGDPLRPNGFQLFVKSIEQADGQENWWSFYGNWQNIQEDKWMLVTVTPGRTPPPDGSMDPDFDPTQVVAVGLKIGTGTGSIATFAGSVWLDDVDWPGGQEPKYGFDNVANALDEIKKTGANTVALVDTWYMDTPTSTVIYSDALKTHTEHEITRTIQAIQDRGMQVLLKPHVDVQDGTWRGEIAPSDPAVWCVSYTKFIAHFAGIANQTHVELFSVGTELESMSGAEHLSCWNTIIDAVRSVYTGTLTYAANWDGYQDVSFWNRMDIVGINAYFPLSDARDPSIDQLVTGWEPWLDEIETWQGVVDKPIVFTEIGYRNVDYCAKEPWRFDTAAPSNCGCQARAYEAILRALGCRSWFQGLFWWNWLPWSDAGGCCDTTFTPQNKPAEPFPPDLANRNPCCSCLPVLYQNFIQP